MFDWPARMKTSTGSAPRRPQTPAIIVSRRNTTRPRRPCRQIVMLIGLLMPRETTTIFLQPIEPEKSALEGFRSVHTFGCRKGRFDVAHESPVHYRKPG